MWKKNIPGAQDASASRAPVVVISSLSVRCPCHPVVLSFSYSLSFYPSVIIVNSKKVVSKIKKNILVIDFEMFLKDNITVSGSKRKTKMHTMHTWWAIRAVRCHLRGKSILFFFFSKSQPYGYSSCHTGAVEPSIWWWHTALGAAHVCYI